MVGIYGDHLLSQSFLSFKLILLLVEVGTLNLLGLKIVRLFYLIQLHLTLDRLLDGLLDTSHIYMTWSLLVIDYNRHNVRLLLLLEKLRLSWGDIRFGSWVRLVNDTWHTLVNTVATMIDCRLVCFSVGELLIGLLEFLSISLNFVKNLVNFV